MKTQEILVYLACFIAVSITLCCTKQNAEPKAIDIVENIFECSEECDTVCPNNFSFHLIPNNTKAFCYETSLRLCTPEGDSIYYGRVNGTSSSIFTGFRTVCPGATVEWCVWKNVALDTLFEICDTSNCLDAIVWFGATNGPGGGGFFGNICNELYVHDTLCFNIGTIECCQGFTIDCEFKVDSTFLDELDCCSFDNMEFVQEDFKHLKYLDYEKKN